MTKCPQCDGHGFELLMSRFGGIRKVCCEQCNGKGYLPQTNEEWMKSVSVSEAIGYFCYKAVGSDGCNACRLNTKEKCRLNEWLKEIHE